MQLQKQKYQTTSKKTAKENTMPYVNIRVAGELTREQKKEISKGVTEVISKAANKPPASILIFIDEVSRENIAKSGNLLDEM